MFRLDGKNTMLCPLQKWMCKKYYRLFFQSTKMIKTNIYEVQKDI